jgi:hypothetical protein
MEVGKNLTHRQKEILNAFSMLSPRGEKIAYDFVLGLNEIYPAIKAEVIPINFNQNRGKRA